MPCQASGRPAPAVRWIKLPDAVTAAEVPGLRYVRPDGTLVFPKFAPKDLRQDVHSALYRCVATNSVGAVASRDVRVRAGEFLFIPVKVTIYVETTRLDRDEARNWTKMNAFTYSCPVAPFHYEYVHRVDQSFSLLKK